VSDALLPLADDQSGALADARPRRACFQSDQATVGLRQVKVSRLGQEPGARAHYNRVREQSSSIPDIDQLFVSLKSGFPEIGIVNDDPEGEHARIVRQGADNRSISHTRDIAVRRRARGARLRTFRCDMAADRSLTVRTNPLSVSAQMRGPPHRTEIPQSRRLTK
jgi:hypothetical protein